MPTFKTKLKQLKDADVRYISLVDRAATRIPFRVLKRDKESKMGIDLMRVFKSDETAKPFVSALVVFAQQDDEATTSIRKTIEQAGFATDRVQKSDEGETVVYPQTAHPGEAQVVRLGDQALVTVANLKTPDGWMGQFIEEHGFFPDLQTATSALYGQVQLVAKSETPQADAQAVLASYGQYLDQMLVLPVACFELNDAIGKLVQKDDDEDVQPLNDNLTETTESESEASEDPLPGETAESIVDKPAGKTKEDAIKAAKAYKDAQNPAKKSLTEAAEADKKKRQKNVHPPAEMAPVDEEDDQKPPPPEEVAKADKTLLSVLKGIESQLTGLTTKVESVVTEQAAQKIMLDEVVQKADTFDATLKGTVMAPPQSEDRLAGNAARMRVQKDDDPRRGNFDTAFLRKRR